MIRIEIVLLSEKPEPIPGRLYHLQAPNITNFG